MMPRPMHFEIHASDPERVKAFYHRLFGWKFQLWSGPMEYWQIRTGASEAPGIDGGMVRRRGPAPAADQPVSAFICTIDVTSVDQTLETAVAAGGVVALPKMAIPGMGWLAYLKDPDGNLLGVMQADSAAK